MAKSVATIRVSIETSRIVADNGAAVVYVIDDNGSKFACHTTQDVADLAPLYVPGNWENSKVLGKAHTAVVGLARLRREAAAKQEAEQRAKQLRRERLEPFARNSHEVTILRRGGHWADVLADKIEERLGDAEYDRYERSVSPRW